MGFVVVYSYLSVFGTNKQNIKHVFWPLTCCLNMLASAQYAIFMRILRNKYEMANGLFQSYMDNTRTYMQLMYPREIDRLFAELRYITNEVKTHYAANTLLFVVVTAAIFVSDVTILSCHLIYKAHAHMNKQAFFISVFRLIFFFFFVREAHNTIQSTKQTVLIAHKALSRTNNAVISKELDTFILSCWIHPIVFDVYDLFDLDYQLIQSILVAVATYTVVLVQIQLALLEHASKANSAIV
ncbi:uncharacterized protein LOC126840715 [Adelges cooleyi]|uniref:uncharacterized protein LOC126840715 n=1 Tax=Adelges cooleyi TaxID=133065 RepID=UPI0021805265|nr:uncharacterized protein LOC126840715 [Adelges cooleyi]